MHGSLIAETMARAFCMYVMMADASANAALRRELARTYCAVRTRFLIADEMTAQLDPSIQKRYGYTLAVCRSRSLGMLVISHQSALLDRSHISRHFTGGIAASRFLLPHCLRVAVNAPGPWVPGIVAPEIFTA